MTRYLRTSRLLLIVLATASLLGGVAVAEEFIVENGEGRAEIVIAADAVPVVGLAARQLQGDILAMTGAELPIVHEPTDDGLVQIYVGRSRHTVARGIAVEDLAHGGYRLVSGAGWLALVGRDQRLLDQRHELAREMLLLARHKTGSDEQKQMWQRWYELTGEDWGLPFSQYWKMYDSKLDVSQLDERGSFNAVVGFLRLQGVRRYMRGELGVVIPRKSTIPLPEVDSTVRPDFPVRYAYEHGHRGGLDWQLWMGFNLAADVQGIAYNFHGTSEITKQPGNPLVDIPKPEEYYMVRGGKRDIGVRQCLSSEKLFEANVKYVRAMFDVFDEPMVSVMPSDSYQNLCECETCAGKLTTEYPFEGQLSNYVWGYVNRVAEEVYKTHPDRKIVGMSYNTYRLPPTNLEQFSPNVVVSIVQHRRFFAYQPESFADIRSKRQGFMELLPGAQPRLLQDDHYRMTRGVPTYYMRSIVMDLRSLKGISMGDFLDINNDRKWPGLPGIRHLNKYVTARYWWDVDQDLDAMLDEYYQLFYGPAAAEMKAFIEYSETNWPGMVEDADKIATVRSLLQAAQERVEADSIYGRRIDLVSQHIAPLAFRAEQLGRERTDVPLQLMAERSEFPVTIDGKLDDAFWAIRANKYSGWLQGTSGDTSALRTRFTLAWAKNALYVAITCREPAVDTLTSTATEDDQPSIWDGDVVELLLETQSHSYYHLAVNPAGALVDLSQQDGEREFRWASNAQVATHIGDGEWTVEMRIPVAGEDRGDIDPLDGVAGFMPTHSYPWYGNICRQRVREGERQTMSFSPTDDNLYAPDRFAKLVRHHRRNL